MAEELINGLTIDQLEERFKYANEMAASGNPVVSNAEWDWMLDKLKELRPDSPALMENWTEDEAELTPLDDLLKQYGMCSIPTLKGINNKEMSNFISVMNKNGGVVDIHCGLKENGHAIRAVYRYGKLVSGSTRGRYKKGRDITKHLMAHLPLEIDEWKQYELVEIRGEALVPVKTFEEKVKGHYMLKTPLSSVTSFMRESATDEEIAMLRFVMYKVLVSGKRPVDTLYDEYEYLNRLGFEIPQHMRLRNVPSNRMVEAVNTLLANFETLMDNGEIEFSCDGLVVAIDNDDIFYGGGKGGNFWNANFAVKEGRYWANNVYSSTILSISWQPGKKFLVPKAVIEPVMCRNGAQVENVPLYNIGVMERYGYTTGETVYFRFGGETGVTLCDYDGNSCKK